MDKYCIINKNSYNININLKNQYLLSTTFFYLEKSYKSTDRYIEGILKIIKFIDENDNYILRIYYDKSIFKNDKYTNLYKLIKLNKKVELYEYLCNNFIYSKPFHIGTFGTLLRFLPLFEKSHYKIIYILDIDDSNYDFINLYVESLIKSNKNFYFYDIEDYGKKYDEKFNNKFGDTIIANIYVKDYRFELKIFTDFLDEISNSKEIFKLIEFLNKKTHSLNNYPNDIIQTYGIDEYFLNIKLINTLDKKNISWIRENLYFNYFITKPLIYDNYNKFNFLIKSYYIDIIKILEKNPKNINIYQKYSIYELKKLLLQIINPNSNSNLKKQFLSNYFYFCQKYKKITLEYYNKYYFIFDETYIDDFISNDFDGISWYIKKNWNIFPKDITSNIKLTFSDN
jgi:hypothetical protein